MNQFITLHDNASYINSMQLLYKRTHFD